MAPHPLPAPGPCAGPPPAPFEPIPFDHLVGSRPDVAARVLAAMRPALRRAQAEAQAALLADAGVPRDAGAVLRAWDALIAQHCPELRSVQNHRRELAETAVCASVYEPEALGALLIDAPGLAHALLDALSPAQRTAMAVAYAAWLSAYGMPVSVPEVIASWEGWKAEGQHAA
jgi:hypothetical protein